MQIYRSIMKTRHSEFYYLGLQMAMGDGKNQIINYLASGKGGIALLDKQGDLVMVGWGGHRLEILGASNELMKGDWSWSFMIILYLLYLSFFNIVLYYD